MPVTLIWGFELGDPSEAQVLSVAPTLSTTIVKDGTYSMRCNGPGIISARFEVIGSGAALANICQSTHFWFRIEAVGSSNIFIFDSAASGTNATRLLLNVADLTLSIRDGAGAGSVTSTNALTTGRWYHIWIDVSGTTRDLYVDGTLWAHSTGGGTAAPLSGPRYGNLTVASGNWDIYFDSGVCHDGSLGAPDNSQQHKIILLLPTAGNNANSWTDGAGGTGDIHGSVDNIPPVGVAASTAAAKIKNAASGGNLDYTATMQSFTAAGIPAGSTIHAVMAICNDGEEITTNTKTGSIWIASNPSQTAASTNFDYGDDGGALGTFPAGWTTHFGPVTVNPSVTLSTAPTVTVRKTTSTTRVVDVDFIGIYVDYTPPPCPAVINMNQSVKRAAFY